MIEAGKFISNRLLIILYLLASVLLIAGCTTKKIQKATKADPEIERNMTSGFSAYSKGDLEKAIFYYQKALETARLANDAEAIANAAYNMAAILLQKGEVALAITNLVEAEAEYTISGKVPPEIYLLYAKALDLDNKYDDALQKLALIADKQPLAISAQRLLISSRLQYKKGELNEAEEALKLILEDQKLLSVLSLTSQAEAMELAAAIANQKMDKEKTIMYLKEAMSLYKKAYAYRKMAEISKQIGTILDKEEDKTAAAEYYLQAARTFYYLNDTNTAAQLFKELDKMVSDKNVVLPNYTLDRINFMRLIIIHSSTNSVIKK